MSSVFRTATRRLPSPPIWWSSQRRHLRIPTHFSVLDTSLYIDENQKDEAGTGNQKSTAAAVHLRRLEVPVASKETHTIRKPLHSSVLLPVFHDPVDKVPTIRTILFTPSPTQGAIVKADAVAVPVQQPTTTTTTATATVVFDSTPAWIQRLPFFLQPQVGTTWYENAHAHMHDTDTDSALTTVKASLLQRVLYGTPEAVLDAAAGTTVTGIGTGTAATATATTTTAVTDPATTAGSFWHRILHGVPESVLDAELGLVPVIQKTTVQEVNVTDRKHCTDVHVQVRGDGKE